MGRKLFKKTKQLRGMGTGEGADYKPYIDSREVNITTATILTDWKTGRSVHCKSQGEVMLYEILRWDDDNIDVREQFPLDNSLTVKIAHESGIRHPFNDEYTMTTDFLVTKADRSMQAYSLKSNSNLSDRDWEKLFIEAVYWKSLGVEFILKYRTDLNETLADNIALVTQYYDEKYLFDKYSAMKYQIAHKLVDFDMEHEIITNEVLNREEGRFLNE